MKITILKQRFRSVQFSSHMQFAGVFYMWVSVGNSSPNQRCCFPCVHLCDHWNGNVDVMTNILYWLNRKLSYDTFRQVMHIPSKWHFYFTKWTWNFRMCMFYIPGCTLPKPFILYYYIYIYCSQTTEHHRCTHTVWSSDALPSHYSSRCHITDGAFPLDNWIRWTLRSLFSHGRILFSHATDM